MSAKYVFSRMTTTQCRLCLADDIPHDDNDHILENSLDSIEEQRQQQHDNHLKHHTRIQEQESWPDSLGIATSLFSLFVVNAAVFILWLGLLDTLKDYYEYKTLMGILLGGPIAFLLGNVYLAYASRRYLKSKIVEYLCFVIGGFWVGIIVGATRYIIKAMENEH